MVRRMIAIMAMLYVGVSLAQTPCAPWNCSDETTSIIERFSSREVLEKHASGVDPQSDWVEDKKYTKVLLIGPRQVIVKRARLSRISIFLEELAIDEPGGGITLPTDMSVAIPEGVVARVRHLHDGNLDQTSSYTLRLPSTERAGLAMRCRDDRDEKRWCAIAAHDGEVLQQIFAFEAQTTKSGAWTDTSLWFAGDLDRDGRIDLLLSSSWYGAAPCEGVHLFLSKLRTPGKTGWGLAASGGSCL